MTHPVRLQLSRAKGFSLQEHSRAVNGLEAVNCARPGMWGNPARIGEYFMVGDPNSSNALTWFTTTASGPSTEATQQFTFVENQEIAAKLFAELMATGFLRDELTFLKGKNLACSCGLDE